MRFICLAFLLIATNAFAQVKVQDLTEDTTPSASADIAYSIKNYASAPTARKVKWNNIVKLSGWQRSGTTVSLANAGDSVSVGGTVTATSFVGDGSGLTGISGAGGGSAPGGTGTELQYRGGSSTLSAVTGSGVIGGNVGLGSTNPGQKLDVQGTVRAIALQAGNGAAVLTGDSNGNVGLGSTAPGKTLDVAGTIRATAFYGDGSNLTGVSTISGLTTGTIPKASSSTAIANSILTEASGNIGLSSASPGTQLDVQGTIRALGFTETGTVQVKFGGNVGIGTASPGSFSLDASTARFTGAGNVGIGSTNPGILLDVGSAGGIRAVGIGTSVPQQMCRCSDGRFGYFNGAWASSCTCPST